jgi:hypothetical protein
MEEGVMAIPWRRTTPSGIVHLNAAADDREKQKNIDSRLPIARDNIRFPEF